MPSQQSDLPLNEELASDAELVQRAQNDLVSFGPLYVRYVNKIYAYIYYRVGSEEQAQDLTAQVFTQAMRDLANYKERGFPFSAWLYRMAHNLVVNWYRSNKRHKKVPLNHHTTERDHSETPDSIAESEEEKEKLREAIHFLPADSQELLTLKFNDNFSNTEIGRIMGRSEGAIKSLYRRTLLALRNRLDNTVSDPHKPRSKAKKNHNNHVHSDSATTEPHV